MALKGTLAKIDGTGSDSIALGRSTTASGDRSIAIGFEANAGNKDGAISIGPKAGLWNVGANTIAIGKYASAEEESSISIGYEAISENKGCICIGGAIKKEGVYSNGEEYVQYTSLGAECTGDYGIGIGAGSLGGKNNSIAISYNARANAVNAIAIGKFANSTGDSALSIGVNANTNSTTAIAIGYYANGLGVNAVAIGRSAQASGQGTAVGRLANASGTSGTAIGQSSNASAQGGTAIGTTAKATGSYGTALGYNTAATESAIAAGLSANASSKAAIAIGVTANVTVDYGIAIGSGAKTLAVGDIAIGTSTNVNRTHSTGLGYQANINTSHSVNCMMLGGSTQTNIYHYGTLRSQSDINDKIDISEIPNGATELFKQLTPIEYYYNYRDEYIEQEEWSEQEIETIDELGNTQKEIIQVCNLSKEEQEKRKKYGQGTYDKEAWQQGLKKHTDPQVGLSAQELLQALENIYGDSRAFPLVGDNFDNFELEEGEEIPEDIEHRYNIAYINLIPFLIKSIKELDARITELEREKGEN